MKLRTILCLIIMFNFNFVKSQIKDRSYQNENFELISEIEFNTLSYKKNYSFNVYEGETEILKILYKRKKTGKLSDNDFEILKQSLKSKGNILNKLTVIIFYPGLDECNFKNENSQWTIFDSDYLRNLNKFSKNNHFWIYKSDENLQYYYPKKINWQLDDNLTIENIFFKMHYPCFSFVVIDNFGNYIANFGEFGKHTVWEYSKELLSIKE